MTKKSFLEHYIFFETLCKLSQKPAIFLKGAKVSSYREIKKLSQIYILVFLFIKRKTMLYNERCEKNTPNVSMCISIIGTYTHDIKLKHKWTAKLYKTFDRAEFVSETN